LDIAFGRSFATLRSSAFRENLALFRHAQHGDTAKIAKGPRSPTLFLKRAIIAYNLLIVGDLGPLAILAVFQYCACRNKAIFLIFN
jgi:hypothetical protein